MKFSDGSVFVCGYNIFGQLGLGDNDNRDSLTRLILPADAGELLDVFVGGYHSVFKFSDGSVYVCGFNRDGQLGLGDKDNRDSLTRLNLPEGVGELIDVYLGGFHSVLKFSDGSVYVCGHDECGQLGLGDNVNRDIQTKLTLPEGVGELVDVCVGGAYSVLKFSDGSVYVCGNNRCGQLGLGDNRNRSELTKCNSIEKIIEDKSNPSEDVPFKDRLRVYSRNLSVSNLSSCFSSCSPWLPCFGGQDDDHDQGGSAGGSSVEDDAPYQQLTEQAFADTETSINR